MPVHLAAGGLHLVVHLLGQCMQRLSSGVCGCGQRMVGSLLQHRKRGFQGVGQVASLGTGAGQVVGLGVQRSVQVVGQGLYLSRKMAAQPWSQTAADR